MRFVVARRIGKLGEGLGNEMFGWSKGFIASQILKAKLIGPSWGLNRRRYYRNFRTTRLDFLLEELFSRLPHYEFTEHDYLLSGQVDFGQAIASWAQDKGLLERSSYTVTVAGMYGGYASIRLARPFLWSQILASRDALTNIHRITSTLDPRKLFVAVHLRVGGDFDVLTPHEQPRGRFNIRIPGPWYTNVCRSLRQAFGNKVQFFFCSDRRGPDLEKMIQEFSPGQPLQSGLTECSDLALMASADLRVCSISSYSLISSFLAQGPYIWYEPQLTYENGCYSLWGHEQTQRHAGSPTAEALREIKLMSVGSQLEESFQGYPVKDDGKIPLPLLSKLQRALRNKCPSANLLEYGAVPDWVIRE